LPTITLETYINAPIERVFDLSRSIDLHMISTHQTKEQAFAGKTSGLIGLGETVTWRASHFGIRQMLTSKITAYTYPHTFTDEMVDRAFKSFTHQHTFAATEHDTSVKDVFSYVSPLGILGRLADALFLKRYMTKLLKQRNQVIKHYAESDLWLGILNDK